MNLRARKNSDINKESNKFEVSKKSDDNHDGGESKRKEERTIRYFSIAEVDLPPEPEVKISKKLSWEGLKKTSNNNNLSDTEFDYINERLWHEIHNGRFFTAFTEMMRKFASNDTSGIPSEVVLHDETRSMWIKLTNGKAFWHEAPRSVVLPNKWNGFEAGSFYLKNETIQAKPPRKYKTTLEFVDTKNEDITKENT